MRTAAWESAPGALAAFLNSTVQAFMVDLFTITLSGGAVLRYTSADVAVTVGGNTFTVGPLIQRAKTKLAVGIKVDSLSLILNADASVTVNSVPLLQFIAAGGLDGAKVQLDRAFTSAPGAAWIGTLSLFKGRVNDVTTSRFEARLTVNSDSELLTVMVPRNVYQPGCSNTLFDAQCGKIKADYLVTCSATGLVGDGSYTAFKTSLTQPDGYFALGIIEGVTGLNAGVARTIKSHAAQRIDVINPWPFRVDLADTFRVYPGCDKTQDTCSAKFANVIHFRGQPYIPAPESIA